MVKSCFSGCVLSRMDEFQGGATEVPGIVWSPPGYRIQGSERFSALTWQFFLLDENRKYEHL